MFRLPAFSAVFGLLLFVGCGPTLEYSTPMTEPGRVSKLVFVPSGHGSDVAVGFSTGKDGGMTLTPIDVKIPARYGIVFECQHGTFAVEGSKWSDLWKSLKEGDEVVIEYREVFEVDDSTKARKFSRFDFIGAVRKTP